MPFLQGIQSETKTNIVFSWNGSVETESDRSHATSTRGCFTIKAQNDLEIKKFFNMNFVSMQHFVVIFVASLA